MQTILVLALEGMMDSGLAITLDTLRAGMTFLANGGRKGQVRVVTAGRKKHIHTGSGMRLTTDLTFQQVISSGFAPNWVLLPGVGMISEAEVAARVAESDAIAAMQLLQVLAAADVKISASCSSVFFLAEAGLLQGRSATMTWWLAPIFRVRYPDIKLDETKTLVRDGQFLTAGAAFSQLDVALAIVTDTMGAEIAHLCSRYLIIEQHPSQARYMMPTHIRQVDTTVIAAERWIDANVAKPISVTDLSAELAVTPKTLARRIQAATGVSPVKFIQRRKLMHAVHLIETTQMSIDSVAEKVGYQDGTALRKLVKREFGTTPGGLR